jgi:hypothetical protein
MVCNTGFIIIIILTRQGIWNEISCAEPFVSLFWHHGCYKSVLFACAVYLFDENVCLVNPVDGFSFKYSYVADGPEACGEAYGS